MSRVATTDGALNPWATRRERLASAEAKLSGEPGFWRVPPGVQVEGLTLDHSVVLGGFARDGYRLTIGGVTKRWTVDPAQVPDDHVLHALRAHRIALLTDGDGEKNAPYATWQRQSPLPLREIELIDRTALEVQLEISLARLEGVFRAPVAQLISREEVVPVHQSRGLRPRTSPYLASHPRDWRYRTLARVHPSRVLSSVRDETLLTYENRAAAGLVARLLSQLDGRLRALRDVNAARDVLTRFQSQDFNSFQLARRVCTLWGEAVSSETDWAGAVEIERDLASWLLRLRLLTQTPLYRAVPPAMRLQSVPAPTNLLSKHPQYQHVYRLWLKLHRQDEASSDDVRLALEEDRNVVDGMGAFTALVVLRALADDGFSPGEEEGVFGRGETVELLHRDGGLSVTLTWSSETDELQLALTASDFITKPLTLVPAAMAVDRLDPLEAQLRRLAPGGSALGERALVCLERRSAGHEQRDLRHDGNDLDPTQQTSIELTDPERPWLIVAISPFQPLSVERVARLLRAWIWPQLLAARPATLSRAESWMELGEVERLWREHDLQRLRRDVGRLIACYTAETDQLRERANPPQAHSTKRAHATRQRAAQQQAARRDLVAAERRLSAARAVEDELSVHERRFAHARRCVVCLQPAVEIERRPHGFALRCQTTSCRSVAGRVAHQDGTLVAFTAFDAVERGDSTGIGREGWQQLAAVQRLSVRRHTEANSEDQAAP